MFIVVLWATLLRQIKNVLYMYILIISNKNLTLSSFSRLLFPHSKPGYAEIIQPKIVIGCFSFNDSGCHPSVHHWDYCPGALYY